MRNQWLDNAIQKKIDRVLEDFDFDAVRDAVRILNLNYTVVDLEDHAKRILEKVAYDDDWGWIGVDVGAGLTAQKLPNGDLILHFSLELASSM
jgi:hypothetical protein